MSRLCLGKLPPYVAEDLFPHIYLVWNMFLKCVETYSFTSSRCGSATKTSSCTVDSSVDLTITVIPLLVKTCLIAWMLHVRHALMTQAARVIRVVGLHHFLWLNTTAFRLIHSVVINYTEAP